jgi:hypothetical protein
LKSLNVSVALDEFGVSFSSLSYWHRLSIDAIKIDRSLVTMNDKERSSAMVLKAVLTIAHELGKDVVAVGVDSEEDLAYARAVGCDFGQGYFYSEMMTEREVVTLLNAIARSTRRDDREQALEERRAARKAEKEREREEKAKEKEQEKALALAQAVPNGSIPAVPPPEVERGHSREALSRNNASRDNMPPAPAPRGPRADVPPPRERLGANNRPRRFPLARSRHETD